MAAGITGLILSCAICAQVPGWATRCRIDSVYEALNGNVIRALVDIDGDRGTYTLFQAGKVAQLRNVQYVASMNHPQGPATAALVGTWHFDNHPGYFVFRAPDANGLVDGYYGVGNQIGRGRIYSWDGIMQVVAVNQPPPAVAKPGTMQPDLGKELLPRFQGLPEAFVGDKGINVPDDWFPKAGSLGQSVGQIVTNDGTGWGVCFMVGDGVALTVKHVFDAVGDQPPLIRFQVPGTAQYNSFKLEGSPLHFGTADLAVMRLAKNDNTPWPPAVKLPDITNLSPQTLPSHKFTAKNAQVIHFPKNQGRRTNIYGRFLDPPLEHGYRYTTETEPGSSGAPVFDFDWNLVAIHWGAQPRADGRPSEYNLGYRMDLVLLLIKQQLDQDQNGQRILKAMGLDK